MDTAKSFQAGFLANSPVTLIANQSTGSANMVNSATVTYSSGAWPTGTAFQINLMSSSENNAAILAQSKMFNITSSGSSTSGSSTGAVPTTMSMSTSSMTPMTSGMSSTSTVVTMTSMSGTASSGSGDASGGIPNAVSETYPGMQEDVLIKCRSLPLLRQARRADSLPPPSWACCWAQRGWSDLLL